QPTAQVRGVGRLKELDELRTTSGRKKILKQDVGILGEKENWSTCATDPCGQLEAGFSVQADRSSWPLTSRPLNLDGENLEAAVREPAGYLRVAAACYFFAVRSWCISVIVHCIVG